MTHDEPESALEVDTPGVMARLLANRGEFLAFLQGRVGDRAVAEDILQEAFVRGVAGVAGLQREESARAWFYRVLRNAVVDHHRRGAAADRRLERLAAELGGEVEPAPELAATVCRCIERLAGTLKPEYGEALRRVEVDGVAVKDYAGEAGITANNAAVRVFRAREALRKQVVRSCGACAEHGCVDCTCEHPR
ncbi:MAG: sigma-70 family RNA polymerase sigma factor [Myxococcales bacterium]|nr:sigma-70 family RNA polymerase sigma factor [Myxococcales bacterium]